MKRLELAIRLAEFQMDTAWSGLSPTKSVGGAWGAMRELHHGDIGDNVLQVGRMECHKNPLLTLYEAILRKQNADMNR